MHLGEKTGLSRNSDSSKYLILLFSLLILSFFLRGIHLVADPPIALTKWSAGIFGDEGGWVHNARNKVLFGKWKLDEENFMYLSPLINYLFYLIFSIFGVGFLQTRLVPLTFSCLSLIFLYLSIKESFNRRVALLATAFIGLDYIHIMHSRIANRSMPMFFFLILTVFLWQRGMMRKNRAYLIASGISCGVSLMCKSSMIYFIPVPVLAIFFIRLKEEDSKGLKDSRMGKDILSFLGGLAISSAIFYSIFIFPNRAELAPLVSGVGDLRIPKDFMHFVRNIFGQNFFNELAGTPIIVIIGYGYGLFILYQLVDWKRKIHPMELLASWWLAVGFIFFAIQGYRPVRFYVSMIPPLSLFTALVLERILTLSPQRRGTGEESERMEMGKVGALPFLALVVGLFFPVNTFVLALLPSLRSSSSFIQSLLSSGLRVAILSGLGTIAISIVLIWISRRLYPEPIGRFLNRYKRPIVYIILIAFVLISAYQYGDWFLNPKYTMIEASRDIGKMIPEGSLVAGLWSPILTLENKNRCLLIWEGFINYERPFERYDIEYLLIMDRFDEVKYYQEKFPEVMKRARLLKEYRLWKAIVKLYALDRGSK